MQIRHYLYTISGVLFLITGAALWQSQSSLSSDARLQTEYTPQKIEERTRQILGSRALQGKQVEVILVGKTRQWSVSIQRADGSNEKTLCFDADSGDLIRIASALPKNRKPASVAVENGVALSQVWLHTLIDRDAFGMRGTLRFLRSWRVTDHSIRSLWQCDNWRILIGIDRTGDMDRFCYIASLRP